MARGAGFIAKESDRFVLLDDDEIDVAIAVEVADRAAPSHPWTREVRPRTGSDVVPLVVAGSSMILVGGLVLYRRRTLQHS